MANRGVTLKSAALLGAVGFAIVVARIAIHQGRRWRVGRSRLWVFPPNAARMAFVASLGACAPFVWVSRDARCERSHRLLLSRFVCVCVLPQRVVRPRVVYWPSVGRSHPGGASRPMVDHRDGGRLTSVVEVSTEVCRPVAAKPGRSGHRSDTWTSLKALIWARLRLSGSDSGEETGSPRDYPPDRRKTSRIGPDVERSPSRSES